MQLTFFLSPIFILALQIFTRPSGLPSEDLRALLHRVKVNLHHGNLGEGTISDVVSIKRAENRLAVALLNLIKLLAFRALFVLAVYIAIPLLIPKRLRGKA